MPKWISLKRAASKYGVKTEDIRFWAEKKEIAWVCTGETFIVDDESIQEFLSQFQHPPTKKYIQTVIQLLENQTVLCDAYTELNNYQKSEIETLERKNLLLEKIKIAMEKQNNNILEIAQTTSTPSWKNRRIAYLQRNQFINMMLSALKRHRIIPPSPTSTH